MSQEGIKEHVRNFLKKNFIFDERQAIDDDASLLGTGILDSTGILELITFLEQAYTITFNDDELTAENFDSVNRIASFILRTQAK